MGPKRLGPAGLAELWALTKSYVSSVVAGESTPPVGYCLVNSGTDPSDDGYAGAWELVCVSDLGGGYLFPGGDTHPGDEQYARPVGAEFWIWRRVE